MFSIIIPCHNEEIVLGAVLRTIESQSGLPPGHAVEVIVAANGCTDRTCAVAESRRAALEAAGFSMRIIDLPTQGKAHALNAADAVAEFAPRIYVDADVELGSCLLSQFSALLLRSEALYVSGTMAIPDAKSFISRAYGRFMLTLPFVKNDVSGIGLYGVSARGRARWRRFPPIHSDDRFVRLQFAPEERYKVPVTYSWPLPDSAINLMKVRFRWNQGNRELARLYPSILTNDQARGSLYNILKSVLKHPVDGAVYCCLFLLTAIWAFIQPGDKSIGWLRGRPTAAQQPDAFKARSSDSEDIVT